MVYSGGFVGCILVNGQVQEERADGIVIVPEGTQYAIRLRNKNDRRAVGQIFIDGENVSGGGYVINANNYVDILRFSDKDEAFRVVGLNSPEAVDAGKNGPNDGTKGVIELRFRLETKREPVPQHVNSYRERMRNSPRGLYKGGTKRGGSDELLGGASYSTKQETSLDFDGERETLTSGGIRLPDETKTCSLFGSNKAISSRSMTRPEFSDCVTVGGSSTGQRFSYTTLDLETSVTVLRIVLKAGEPKPKVDYCSHCGTKRHPKDRFCSHCGHSIILSR
jgi:hypothetical protein